MRMQINTPHCNDFSIFSPYQKFEKKRKLCVCPHCNSELYFEVTTCASEYVVEHSYSYEESRIINISRNCYKCDTKTNILRFPFLMYEPYGKSEPKCKWFNKDTSYDMFWEANHLKYVMRDSERCKEDFNQLYPIIKKMEQDREDYVLLDDSKEPIECPICHNSFVPCWATYWGDDESELNWRFEKLHTPIEEADGEKAEARRNKIIAKYDIAPPMNQSGSKTFKNTEELKEHINILFTLEMDIHSVEERLLDLYVKEYACERDVAAYKGLKIEEAKKSYEQKKLLLTAAQNSRPERVTMSWPQRPTEPRKPFLQRPGLFNRKKVLEYNEQLTTEYEEAVRKYTDNLAKYERETEECKETEKRLIQEAKEKRLQTIVEAEKNAKEAELLLQRTQKEIEDELALVLESPHPVMVTYKLVVEEIATAEDTLGKLLECRNKLYAFDVVFGKYRNIVALATFFEYLVSGRCTALEGPNGAYNIYEAEIRANQIIGQLTKIVQSLEDIKENQYLIYSQLQETNATLHQLNNTMNNVSSSLHNISGYMEIVADNTAVIAHNTAVNAYYSKINAQLTNSLGYMIALH